jgi:molybdopterin-guanine dinucleotide biosynthesis protein A
MGRPKALLPFQGGTFLSVILDRLRALGLPFMAVVRGPDLLLPEEVLAGLPVLVNPDPETGPIGSIQAGLKAGARGFPWLLAVPVDHPAVTLESLGSRRRGWGRAPVGSFPSGKTGASRGLLPGLL